MTAAAPVTLTELEALIVAEVLTNSNSTPYEVMKAVGDSKLTGFTASPGSIYPAVKRLCRLGLLEAHAETARSRRIERLRATQAGRDAVQAWVLSVAPSDLLPHDPLRSKLLYFGVLSPEQQKTWVAEMRAALQEAHSIMKACARTADGSAELAANMAVAEIKQRRSWIDRVATRVRTDEDEEEG